MSKIILALIALVAMIGAVNAASVGSVTSSVEGKYATEVIQAYGGWSNVTTEYFNNNDSLFIAVGGIGDNIPISANEAFTRTAVSTLKTYPNVKQVGIVMFDLYTQEIIEVVVFNQLKHHGTNDMNTF